MTVPFKSVTPFPLGRLLWPVLFLSIGILSFEISLLRVLLCASWNHFAFLVISVALLGFGTSGTVLCFLRHWLISKGDGAIFYLVLATSGAMPISLQIAKLLPLDSRFLPALLGWQILFWVVCWALLFLPFLIGSTAIGLGLIMAGNRVPTLYAFSLIGSALGVVAVTAAMHILPPAWLAVFSGGLTMIGAFSAVRPQFPDRLLSLFILAAGVGSWVIYDPPEIRADPYKYQNYVDQLLRDGKVERLARAYGPGGFVEAYRGDVFHELAFLASGESPPPMVALLVDGNWVGSVLQVTDSESARVVEKTLMSFPYDLLPPNPRVLLLGETDGVNIWLAHRNQAEAIHVVQPSQELISLIRGPLRNDGGGVFNLPGVTVVPSEPRHYTDRRGSHFDLIHLAGLQSWSVETGGIGGLRQDHLVTVEGLAACLSRLSSNGILSVCRGIQFPPRDNLKFMATLVQSLKRLEVQNPDLHLVVIRDYLAACIMAKRTPWSRGDIEDIRNLCDRRELTPVYFPGILPEELNRPDTLPGPPGEPGDWLHHSVKSIMSGESNVIFDRWPFDIRPPTDDRPFFWDLLKLASIPALKEIFGDLWLTRTELSFLFVLAATAIIAFVGSGLILLPLARVAEVRNSPGIWPTVVYFISIGLAYLTLEITFLSALTRLIGEPVLAGAGTITSFLLFSGIGGLVAQRIDNSKVKTIRLIACSLVVVGFLVTWNVSGIAGRVGFLGLRRRLCIAVLLIAPLGFFMGFFMPFALSRLTRGSPALLPWAWGLNGFASVLAPPIATAIAMNYGFRLSAGIAMCLYLLAALVIKRLPCQPSIQSI